MLKKTLRLLSCQALRSALPSTLYSLPGEVCKARTSFWLLFSSLGPFLGELEPPLILFFFFFYPKVLYFVVENLLRPSLSQTECFKRYSWYLWLRIFFALCPPLPFLKVFEPSSTIQAKLGP